MNRKTIGAMIVLTMAQSGCADLPCNDVTAERFRFAFNSQKGEEAYERDMDVDDNGIIDSRDFNAWAESCEDWQEVP